jgi:ferredoxin
MDLLSAAERLTDIDRSAIRYEAGRCLIALEKFSECDACIQLCPTGAILPGKPPEFQPESCAACYACLPACPVGAYHADDSFSALLTSTARVESGEVEVVCSRHPHPERATLADATTLCVRGCLAGLGVGGWLALFSVGVQRVVMRLEHCQACEWQQRSPRLQGVIAEQAATARRWLSAWGLAAALEICQHINPTAVPDRPAWDAHNPPLTRRDLFRLASRQGQLAAARAMDSAALTGGPRPGRERSRVLNAARRLHAERKSFDDFGLDGLGYAMLTVSEACTACGACGRACPTGALRFGRDGEKTFKISFNPGECIDCKVCAQVCAPSAIQIDPRAMVSSLLLPDPILLQEGELAHCRRCNALIASRPGVYLCPVCQFRRDHPFGSQLPPGMTLANLPGKPGAKS